MFSVWFTTFKFVSMLVFQTLLKKKKKKMLICFKLCKSVSDFAILVWASQPPFGTDSKIFYLLMCQVKQLLEAGMITSLVVHRSGLWLTVDCFQLVWHYRKVWGQGVAGRVRGHRGQRGQAVPLGLSWGNMTDRSQTVGTSTPNPVQRRLQITRGRHSTTCHPMEEEEEEEVGDGDGEERRQTDKRKKWTKK